MSKVEPSGFAVFMAVGCGARRVKKVTGVWLGYLEALRWGWREGWRSDLATWGL